MSFDWVHERVQAAVWELCSVTGVTTRSLSMKISFDCWIPSIILLFSGSGRNSLHLFFLKYNFINEIQVTCETDFSSRNETFQAFAAAAAQACFDKVPLPPAPGVHPVNLEALLEMPIGVTEGSSRLGWSVEERLLASC